MGCTPSKKSQAVLPGESPIAASVGKHQGGGGVNNGERNGVSNGRNGGGGAAGAGGHGGTGVVAAASPNHDNGDVPPDNAFAKNTPVGSNVTDRYDIGDLLGKGSFGSVFLGVDKVTGEKTAIKVMDRSRIKGSSIEREWTVLEHLGKHENVVEFKGAYATPKEVCFVLELMNGGELFDRLIKTGAYSESEAREPFRQVASALHYLHTRGIIHRDLKPENLLLVDRSLTSDVKIADFGLSQLIKPGQKLTKVCGTWAYAAPEMSDPSAGGYDCRFDTWGFGVILFVVLCGYHPFDPEGGLPVPDIKARARAAQFDFDQPEWDHVSDTAKDLLSKLIVKDPNQRLDSASILKHPWFTHDVPSEPISDEIGSRILTFQAKMRRKLKASIYGSFFVTSLRTMSMSSLMRAQALSAQQAAKATSDGDLFSKGSVARIGDEGDSGSVHSAADFLDFNSSSNAHLPPARASSASSATSGIAFSAGGASVGTGGFASPPHHGASGVWTISSATSPAAGAGGVVGVGGIADPEFSRVSSSSVHSSGIRMNGATPVRGPALPDSVRTPSSGRFDPHTPSSATASSRVHVLKAEPHQRASSFSSLNGAQRLPTIRSSSVIDASEEGVASPHIGSRGMDLSSPPMMVVEEGKDTEADGFGGPEDTSPTAYASARSPSVSDPATSGQPAQSGPRSPHRSPRRSIPCPSSVSATNVPTPALTPTGEPPRHAPNPGYAGSPPVVASESRARAGSPSSPDLSGGGPRLQQHLSASLVSARNVALDGIASSTSKDLDGKCTSQARDPPSSTTYPIS